MTRAERLVEGVLLGACLALSAVSLAAQRSVPRVAPRSAFGAADSTLVRRILQAEDRRDAADPALSAGTRSADGRIRLLARRALDRITDSLFAARDSFPSPAPPTVWPEPAWRLRYRALALARDDCAILAHALADSSWPVRLHAADLLGPRCAGAGEIVRTLRGWIAALPADVSRRSHGGVSWHAAAHALVALGRLAPDSARPLTRRFAEHQSAHLRQYAARAAAELGDTATLRVLAVDTNANVRESAIDALAELTHHTDDSVFERSLASSAPQVVRAAALALVGSPDSGARARAYGTFLQWTRRDNDSERDVRVALLRAAGRPPADDRPPPHAVPLPAGAVSLALGADVRLRVTMSPASGGGSFIVRLRGDAAPITAARILELARRGYYDGDAWHRVEHDFVIEGGGPLDNEYSGYHRYFRDELSTVGHARGTVGMSTRGHDTGDAQWFINLRDNPRLDTTYTVFGDVVEGMGVVDDIMEGDVIASITPLRR